MTPAARTQAATTSTPSSAGSSAKDATPVAQATDAAARHPRQAPASHPVSAAKW